jgi:methylmalonyl-CoA mutase
LVLEGLRQLTARGIELDVAAARLRIELGCSPEMLVELAKLRAARLLLARLLAACGAGKQARAPHVHVRMARWGITRHDRDTNLLRASLVAWTAITAGADGLELAPRGAAWPGLEPTSSERRMTRNIQLVLREECGLAAIVDPAGGSYAVEALTDQLARAAWSGMQEIERGGGIAALLATGELQRRCQKGATQREQRLARRQATLVGTSQFVDLDTALLAPPTQPDRRCEGALAGGGPGAEYAARVATWGWSPNAVRCEALRLRRPASIYERLRAATQAAVKPPVARQINLGCSAAFRVRADWARDALAAIGIAVSTEDDVPVEHLAAVQWEGEAIVLICGRDADYPAALPVLESTLTQRALLRGVAPPRWVVAGRIDAALVEQYHLHLLQAEIDLPAWGSHLLARLGIDLEPSSDQQGADHA